MLYDSSWEFKEVLLRAAGIIDARGHCAGRNWQGVCAVIAIYKATSDNAARARAVHALQARVGDIPTWNNTHPHEEVTRVMRSVAGG